MDHHFPSVAKDAKHVNVDYNEADTCRLYVTPKLRDAGWEEEPYSITEQRTFTDGQIVVTNSQSKRDEGKKADYRVR